MQTVVLIACSKQKLLVPAPAEALYISQLFRKSLAYARLLGADAIYILSAKHGLLKTCTVIAPYDETLHAMSGDAKRCWGRRVLEQLSEVCDVHSDTFVFLAGDAYRKDLIGHLAQVEVPMRGLGIGQQLKFLTHRVAL